MNNLELRRATLARRHELAMTRRIAGEVHQVRGQIYIAEEIVAGVGRLTHRAIVETIQLGELQVAAAKISGGVVDSDVAFLRSTATLSMAQVISRTSQVLMP